MAQPAGLPRRPLRPLRPPGGWYAGPRGRASDPDQAPVASRWFVSAAFWCTGPGGSFTPAPVLRAARWCTGPGERADPGPRARERESGPVHGPGSERVGRCTGPGEREIVGRCTGSGERAEPRARERATAGVKRPPRRAPVAHQGDAAVAAGRARSRPRQGGVASKYAKDAGPASLARPVYGPALARPVYGPAKPYERSVRSVCRVTPGSRCSVTP